MFKKCFFNFRRLHPISQNFVSGINNIDIVPLVKQIEDLVKEGKSYQDTFTKIAKNETNCSATMFFKAKYDIIYSIFVVTHY